MARKVLRPLVFLLLVLGVWGGGHLYFFDRLVDDPALPQSARVLLGGLLAVLGLLPFAALTHRLPEPFARPVHLVAYIWMGAAGPLVALLGAGDLVEVVLGRFASAAGGGGMDPLLWARGQAGLTALAAVGLAGVGFALARRPPPLKRVEVTLDRWPRALDGLRIVQISDLHVDATTQAAEVEALVDRVNALGPDLVALTGDLVDGSPRALAEKVAPLGKLRAKHGVWFVTGNHEYYSGGDRWIETMRGLGIQVLHNERVVVEDNGARFELAGVPDWTGGDFGERHRPRLADTLAGRDPSLEVILLAHQPRQFPEAAALGVGLQLSGHTHGGQIWPFTLVVALVEPFVAGLHRRGRSQLYVSRGTGTWGPPMRLGAPHELTQLTLRAAA